MPIRNYSILKGTPVGGSVQFDHAGRNPHYLIDLDAGGNKLQAAVNIESEDGSEVLYSIRDPLTPPNESALTALSLGRTALVSVAGGLAIDYVRSRVNEKLLVDRNSMSLLPVGQTAQTSDLHNAIVDLLDQVVADEQGTVYAFGSFFQDPGQTGGVHDIHMNQGNPPGNHGDDNGIWQDGALLLQMPSTGRWTGIFIAFQSQSWHTDDRGNPL